MAQERARERAQRVIDSAFEDVDRFEEHTNRFMRPGFKARATDGGILIERILDPLEETVYSLKTVEKKE